MVRTNKLLVFFMEIFQVLKMDINIKIICTSIIIHCITKTKQALGQKKIYVCLLSHVKKI